jgi:hypothetical protein
VFLAVGVGLLIFTLFPETLNLLGRVFWLQRWADVLVYASIVFLLYFSLLLLAKNERNREDITRLVREISLLETRLSMQGRNEVFSAQIENEDRRIDSHPAKIHNQVLIVSDKNWNKKTSRKSEK